MLFAFVLYPIISNLSFHPVMNECYKYYPKHKMIVNGVVLSGTAFGHIFFGTLDDVCMNPNDVQAYDKYYGRDLDYITLRFPSCMRSESYLGFAVGVGAVALISPLLFYNSRKTT